MPCTQTQFSILSNCLRSLNIMFIYPTFAKWGKKDEGVSLLFLAHQGKELCCVSLALLTPCAVWLTPFPHSPPYALVKSSAKQKAHETSHLINRYQKITALSVSNDPFTSPVGPVKKSNSKAKNNLHVCYFGLSFRLLLHIASRSE